MGLWNNLIVLDEIESTNNYLKQYYDSLVPYTVIRANYQSNGRGQFERGWESTKNKNLLFSILFKLDLGFSPDLMNPIIVTAIKSTLDEMGINASFKDPNDVYVGDKKIAGILIETKYDANKLKYMVVGVGLNVNQLTFDDLNAVSIHQLLGSNQALEPLLMRILTYVEHNLMLLRFIQGGKNDNKTTY